MGVICHPHAIGLVIIIIIIIINIFNVA